MCLGWRPGPASLHTRHDREPSRPLRRKPLPSILQHVACTCTCLHSSVAEHQSCKLKVLGSIPSGGSLCTRRRSIRRLRASPSLPVPVGHIEAGISSLRAKGNEDAIAGPQAPTCPACPSLNAANETKPYCSTFSRRVRKSLRPRHLDGFPSAPFCTR